MYDRKLYIVKLRIVPETTTNFTLPIGSLRELSSPLHVNFLVVGAWLPSSVRYGANAKLNDQIEVDEEKTMY